MDCREDEMTKEKAKAAANSTNAGIVFSGLDDDGCRFEVFYCDQRCKQIWTTITPNGVRIE